MVLAIAQAFSSVLAIVDDPRHFIMLRPVDERHRRCALTIRTTAFKIGLAIDRVIERAGEAIVISDKVLDRRPVFVDISPQSGLHGFQRTACHRTYAELLLRDPEYLARINLVRALQHRFVRFEDLLVVLTMTLSVDRLSDFPEGIALLHCVELGLW